MLTQFGYKKNTTIQALCLVKLLLNHCYLPGVPQEKEKKRHLPLWLSDTPSTDDVILEKTADGMLDYACAVLSDGLEFRRGISRGNDPEML